MRPACIHDLLLSGRVLKEGSSSASARALIRRMIGRAYPVTQREFSQAIATASTLFLADDPAAAALDHRDRLDRILQAVVAIDASRAKRAGDDSAASKLKTIWQLIQLRLGVPETLAELLDVGAYKGGLIDSIRSSTRPELDYFAIDLDPSNVACTLSVDKMDATCLDLPNNSVGQVYLLDILEHLHGEQQLFDAVEEAVRVAADVVYAECPNFGDDDYLRRHGLKWCWSDWTGHTLPATLELFQRAVSRLNLDDIAEVDLGETVYDSNHRQMVRFDAPTDMTVALPEIQNWRPKEIVRFDRALHHRVFMRIRKNPCAPLLWESPTRRTAMRPEDSRQLPREAWRLNALLTKKLDRKTPVSDAEIQTVNDLLGQIFQGAAPEPLLELSKAPRDVLRGMVDLYAYAVEGDGKHELARDIRELALGDQAPTP